MAVIRFRHLTLRLMLSLGLALTGGCASSSFSGGSAKKAAPEKDKDKKKDDDPDKAHDEDHDSDLAENTDVEPGDDTDLGNTQDGLVREKFFGGETVLDGQVDIVFAMDTSGSMRSEQKMLEQHMSTFLNQFNNENKDADFLVYMIGDDFNFPALGSKFMRVNEGVSSHDALEVFQRFLSGGLGGQSVRAGSQKHLVVITDDEARGVTAGPFKSFVMSTPNLSGKTTFNGFVILPTSNTSDWCTRAGVGNEYISLANDPDLKGLIQDLCTNDWSMLLKNLAAQIMKKEARRNFRLKAEPNPPGSLKVEVDGSPAGSSRWSFDQAANAIVFQEDAAPGDGAVIVVTYAK